MSEEPSASSAILDLLNHASASVQLAEDAPSDPVAWVHLAEAIKFLIGAVAYLTGRAVGDQP